MFYQSKQKNNDHTDQIEINQKYGDKITHSNWNLSGSKIQFDTASEGKGEIQTSIPKKLIPEANAWMNKRNIIQTNALYLWTNGRFVPGMSLNYYRRFNCLAFGGGVIIGQCYFGVQAGVLFLF